MCRLVTCKTCSKPTWAGCGLHIESVLGHVAEADRCTCREQRASEPSQRSLFARLFGR
jgi:hypothetical protein